jgi:hypothetical protein
MFLKNKYWDLKEREFNNFQIAKFFMYYILSPYDKIRLRNKKVLDFRIKLINIFVGPYKFKVARLHTTQEMIDDLKAIQPFDIYTLEKDIIEELSNDINKQIQLKIHELGLNNYNNDKH